MIYLRIPNLVYSTLVLFLSNFIVRIIGFLYKIFLSNNLSEVHLGIYHMVFNFLMICIALTTTGIPTALSCLVARKKAFNDKHSTNALFISAIYISFFIASLIAFFVSVSSESLSIKLLHSNNSSIFILALCPSIIAITLSNIVRGYYYGIKQVDIPAVSQVLEQISKIVFVYLIVKNFNNPTLICLSAIIGISIGECISLSFMTLGLARKPYIDNKYTIDIKEFMKSSYDTVKMSIPITCNRMSSIVLNSISSMIIPSRLALSGITYTTALGVYGTIAGMVFPFVHLPFMLVSALVVNIIPSISLDVSRKNIKSIKSKILFALVLTVVMGFLCSLIFYLFGEKICLYTFKNKVAGFYLKYMCLVPLFLSLNHVISGILHSIGKEFISSVIGISSMIIQTLCLYFILPIPDVGLWGYILILTVVPIITFAFNSHVLFKSLKSLY
ncbi:oligosaccharide flippase family protein [Paraclostridium bifermentans]|uniref:oligosaccharide flippase family protein n=1 Tax=Paraclostridium bifermentans TaxID=1490 RepID=UPI001FF238E5|nr:oligosaccharide flippase family protein [Paraclostridium bifermentans]UOW68402.1 oligosaccharide flippase family protein [Paraclostridium bifermentans]